MSVYGPFNTKVVDLHDGDTIHLDINQGFGSYALAHKVRD